MNSTILYLVDAKNALNAALTSYNADATRLKTAPLPELASTYVRLFAAHEALDTARKAINAEIEHLSKSVIPDRLSEEGVKNIKIEVDGQDYRVGVGYRNSASMLDQEAGIAWLKENGHAGIVKETVAAQTLASFAVSYLETEGRELPEDLFKTGRSPYTSKTKV